MSYDINNFRLSLAFQIAALCTPTLKLVELPRELWVGNAIEAEAAPVYSALRIYGGNDEGAFAGGDVPSASVQHDTRGIDEAAVLARAWAIHESLKDSQGRPRMHWSIPGKKFDGDGAIVDDDAGDWEIRIIIFNGRPGVRGRVEERWMATGNFDVEFFFVPAA